MAKTQEIPAYLQSEEAFKSVISYDQRKEVVQGHERKFGVSGKYTGETHQNLAIIRYLQDNPNARKEWEDSLGITKAALGTLRQETQGKRGLFGRIFGKGGEKKTVASVAAGNNYFAQENRNDGEINAQGRKAIEAGSKEKEFMDINNELVRAWRKDIGGRIITGGLLGMIESRTSNLNKALRVIEKKYDAQKKDAIVAGLQSNFARINELSKAAGANPATKFGKDVIVSALSPFGFERAETLQKIQSNPRFTGRLSAFLQVAIGAAISTAMGSPTIYLGSLNTGIKMKDIRNPNKDVISNALFSESYNTVLQAHDREYGKYNRMLGDNGVSGGTLGTAEEYRKISTGIAGEGEEAVNEGLKATGGWKLFRVFREVFTKSEREIIVDRNAPLEKKYAAADRAIAELGDKPQTDNVRATIAELQHLKTLYGRRENMRSHIEDSGTLEPQYREAYRVMSRFTEYDDIKGFVMPEKTREWAKVYIEGGRGYKPKDINLLKHLWDSKDAPLFQAFIKAQPTGNVQAYNEMVLRYEGANSTKKGVDYGRNLSKINTAGEVADYLGSREEGYGRLASIYAAKINSLAGGKIQVDPNDIVRYARSAQLDSAGALNSGLHSNNLNTLKNYSGNGWMFDVPVTYTSEGYIKHGLLRIGVKPNCANLLIGDIHGERWYDSTNLASPLNFRIPLFLQIPKGGKTTKGEKPGKPDKPNEPCEPGNPNHPQQQVSSTPYAGEPVNATTATGQVANNVPAGLPSGAGTNIPPTTYVDSFGNSVVPTIPTAAAPGFAGGTATNAAGTVVPALPGF